jgi:hypothetical protein
VDGQTCPYILSSCSWYTCRNTVSEELAYSYENNQQDALYRLIYYSKSALHVLGDVFAHHQEHLSVFTVSGSVHPSCCRQVSWMSWNWTMWIMRRVYMFRAMFSPIIRNTWLYLQYLVVFTHVYTRLRIHIVQFQLIQDTSRQQRGWTLPDTVNIVKFTWWWAKT